MNATWREKIGDYTLIREIGRGAFGIVYEAEQAALKRRVALKVLPAHLFSSGKVIERFRTEAIAAAQLRHPNIVTVHEAGEDGDVYYFSMDRIEGRSLDEEIQERADPRTPAELNDSHFLTSMSAVMTSAGCATDTEPPATAAPPREAGSLPSRAECFGIASRISDVADALHYAHEKGVLHQDIKPSNMMLDDSGRLCLLDFGTAQIRRLRDDPELRADVVATPLYASPEQFAGGDTDIDRRSDVYSLGASLYQWATLRPPFTARGYAELQHRVLHAPLADPRTINPSVPRELAAVIVKSLARRREDRYATAEEFARDLRRFLRGEATAAAHTGLLRRLVLWRRRNRALAAALAAAVTLGILACAVLLYFTLTALTPLDTARQFMRVGAWHDALRILDDYANALPPQSSRWPAAMLLKADCLNRLDRHEERLDLYTSLLHAERLDMDRVQILIGMAKALVDLRRFQRAEQTIYDAIDAAATRSSKAEAYYELAKFRHDRGLADDATRLYAMALENDPALAKAYFQMGTLAMNAGDYGKAAQLLIKAVELREVEPDTEERPKPKYMAMLAACYFRWGKLDEALTCARKASHMAASLGQSQNSARHKLLAGRILTERGDLDDAIATLNEAVEELRDRDRASALYALAEAQLRAGKQKDLEDTAGGFLYPEYAIYPAMLWARIGNQAESLRYLRILDSSEWARLRKTSPELWTEFASLVAAIRHEDPVFHARIADKLGPDMPAEP